MTRKKIELARIVNDASRKASLKKRRVGLSKKVRELTTLCGTDAFIIIYSPNEPRPVVWPTHPNVQQLLMRFLSMPESERFKKMTTLESYLKQRIIKVREQSMTQKRKNDAMNMSYYMQKINQGNGIDDFELAELNEFNCLVQEKVREIGRQIGYVKQVPPLSRATFNSQHPNIKDVRPTKFDTNGDGDRRNSTNAMLLDQWFYDLMNNGGNIAGASNTKHDMEPPHTYNVGNSFGDGSEIRLHRESIGDVRFSNTVNLGLPPSCVGGNIGGSSVGLALPYGHINETVMGLPYGNVTVGSNDNAMRLGLPFDNITASSARDSTRGGLSRQGNIEGNVGSLDLRLPVFYSGDGDTDLPYDVSEAGPYNFPP